MERIPKPTRTNPRMQRGLQILRDLGAIEDGAGGSTLTPFGQRMLRQIADEQ
jgi:ribosomal protein S19E (S16A)